MDNNLVVNNDAVLEIQSKGLFFQFYFRDPFGWKKLAGPYRGHFMKTPEDLIKSLKQLNWSDDEHCAHILTMSAYLELKVPKYERSQDLCVFKLYAEATPTIIVVKEKELATYQKLAWNNFHEKQISTENQNKLAIVSGLSVDIIEPGDLVVNKDDLHEMFPKKSECVSQQISNLFYPTINFVADANVFTK